MLVLARSTKLIALLLFVAILAACDTAAPTPSPSPTPSPAGGLDLHAFPELEARLPDDLGGLALTKSSVAPEEDQGVTSEVLRQLGRSASDMQLAVAVHGASVQISALRVVDSDGAQIAAAFRQIEEASSQSVASYATVELGGRSVVSRTTPNQTTYIHSAEDIMFVLSGEQELIEEALAELP